jgi:hypothetical protein
VIGPRVICIGSDQSPALSRLRGPGTGMPSVQNAAVAAFSEHPSLSAAIVITIENVLTGLGRPHRGARGELLINPFAFTTDPLAAEEVQALSSMNFNRWTYTRPLEKWESTNVNIARRVAGTLTWRPGLMGLEVEIPANIVVDALAGKRSVAEAFGLPENHQVTRALKDGWSVVSVRMIEGHIESGEAPKLVLELVPPPLAAYWPKK